MWDKGWVVNFLIKLLVLSQKPPQGYFSTNLAQQFCSWSMDIVRLLCRGGGEGLVIGVQVGVREIRGEEATMEERGIADYHLSPGFQDVGAGDGYQEPYGGPIIIILEASLIPVKGVCLDVDENLSFCQHLEDLPGDCVSDIAKGFKVAEGDCVRRIMRSSQTSGRIAMQYWIPAWTSSGRISRMSESWICMLPPLFQCWQ
jgi:hypothetical protein